jgi:YHS domain-containing protein
MKRFFLTLIVLVSAIGLIACGGEQKAEVSQEQQAAPAVEQPAVAEGKAVCPACEMEMNKADMLAVEMDGGTKYFCNENCENHYKAMHEDKDHEGHKEGEAAEKKSM